MSDLPGKTFLNLSVQLLGIVGKWLFRLRPPPALPAAGMSKVGWLLSGTAYRTVAITRPSRITAFGFPVNQCWHRGSLAATLQAEHLAGRLLFGGDFLLQLQNPLQKSFRTRRTAGDIDINRKNLVDALDDTVNVVHAT